MVMTPTEAGKVGFGMMMIELVAYFYANNGLMALNQLERLQRAFDVLTGLFDQVGLRKNTKKTVGMV